MKQRFLRDLIEEKMALGRESATGFRSLRCQVCNDHSERAGVKIDGDIIGYNCFNCQASFTYEECSGKLSRNAKRILECYGITKQEIEEVLGSAFFVKSAEPKTITLEAVKQTIVLHTPTIPLPPKSYPLGAPHNDELQAPLIEYLLKRKLDPLKLNAHFSVDPAWLNRVILPCMRDGKVIFWQARTVLDGVKPRYKSAVVSKAAVLWGYDNMWKNPTYPLFITEGITDAVDIDGVALLGSKLNDSKLEVLNKCRRRKIVVIDRDDNGSNLGEIALEHGWDITFVSEDSKDVNSSIIKHGLLFTVRTLIKNATKPVGLKTTTGIPVESKLALDMQLALAKLGKRK